MPYDYSNTFIKGNLFFPDFEEGLILGVDNSGKVVPLELPTLKTLTFYQPTPSGHWEFTHDLGSVPFAVVYDSQGSNITGQVIVDVDDHTVEVSTENCLVSGKVIVYLLGVGPRDGEPNSLALTRITQDFTINGAIAQNANLATSIELAKTFQILKFSCATPVRIRIYITQAHQTADLNRASTVLPTGDHGLIFEGITSVSYSNIYTSPVPTGYSLENASTSYITITNLAETNLSTVTFNLTYLPLEVASVSVPVP